MAQLNKSEIQQPQDSLALQPADEKSKSLGKDEMATPPPDSELEDANSDSNHLQGVRLYLVVFSLSCAYFLILLNSTIVVTAIPQITSDFHSLNDVGWYGSAYLLTNCAIQPLSGKIYKHHSLKSTFLSFLAIFELGSLLCGVSVSSNMLIVGRAVAGSGASGIMNGAMTIIVAATPANKRPALIGFAVSFGMIGQIMGPLVGGALTEHVTWRWCFYLNLPLGGATAALLLFTHIPDERAKEKLSWGSTLKQLDLIGFCAFSPSIVMLLLALDWGGSSYAWGSATVIGLLCGAFVLFCIFLYWEYIKGSEALIPLALLRNRIIASSYCNGMLQAGALMQMTYFLPLWFQIIKDDSPTTSGVNVLPTVGSQIVFAAIGGVLVQKSGFYLPFAILGGVMTAVGAGMLSTLVPSTNAGKWAGYQILTGGGRGFGTQQPALAISVVLSKDDLAVGNSVLTFSTYLGGAVFVSAANNLMNDGIFDYLRQFAPTISPETIIQAGATNLRDVVSKEDLPRALHAYNRAITQTFYIAAAASGAAAIAAFGMGWVNVKKMKAEKALKVEPITRDAKETTRA